MPTDHPFISRFLLGCAYFTRKNQDTGAGDKEGTRNRVASLMGCGNPAVNKINAMEQADDLSATCLSNGNGCGDCFDGEIPRLNLSPLTNSH